MSVQGKDLTAMMSGAEPPPRRRQQPTYPAPSAQGGEEYAVHVTPAPSRGLSFEGSGQWRTIFKQFGKDAKVSFTTERPVVTTTGNIIHLHSERFDFIMDISKVEELGIEFGEIPIREESDDGRAVENDAAEASDQ